VDDETLWETFRTTTLPMRDWTHRAHVRTAFLHLARWPLDEAHVRMRVGIVRLNASHHLEETPARGYHETLTRVWLVLVASARDDGGTYATSEALLERHPWLLEKNAPLQYYSRERLFALRARAVFVEPDLAALPLLAG
jgi:hypothetical protein